MSYVKALFGKLIGEGLTLEEGKVGFIDNNKDYQYKDLEKRGRCKLFPSAEDAEAFQFIPSLQLFNKSYKTLNPPEGETVAPSLIDWESGDPIVVNGIPSNHIPAPVVEKELVKEPVANKAPEKKDLLAKTPEAEVKA